MLLVLLNLGNMVKGQYEKSRAFSTLTIANNKKKTGKTYSPTETMNPVKRFMSKFQKNGAV